MLFRSDEIERTAKIPDHVIKGLFELGAFGMKIPKEYGGLGYSHKNYGRVLTLIASWSNILALTVAVPQSIGIAMPILLFGNEEQKKRYLPRVAREDVSAFALTEPMTGSDAANIQTEAVLDSSGRHFLVNGEKLWCTNGTVAEIIVVMARHTDSGKISAFIVEMDWPGVEVVQRLHFMGLGGIENRSEEHNV